MLLLSAFGRRQIDCTPPFSASLRSLIRVSGWFSSEIHLIFGEGGIGLQDRAYPHANLCVFTCAVRLTTHLSVLAAKNSCKLY
jgi:hypothetical protein